MTCKHTQGLWQDKNAVALYVFALDCVSQRVVVWCRDQVTDMKNQRL